MTKMELIQMTGSGEQANLAIEILLGAVKPDFIRTAINAEISETEKKIKAMEDEGFIYSCNGSWHVNWGKAQDLNGWHLTEEQEAAYGEAYSKCLEAKDLLYLRNRLISLIATRN